MSACSHSIHSSCDESCECICDFCTTQYEIQWNKYVSEKNLCKDCGFPSLVSLETLKETRYIHFYQPCDSCKPSYLGLMMYENRCVQCQDPLLGGKCPGCFCEKNTETCGCRQCTAYRKQHATVDNESSS